MADAFMSALFGASEVKASARVKLANGETRSVKLRAVPESISEQSFANAARDGGVDLSVKVQPDDDRARSINGKGVYGAAAVSATCSVLGFTPKADKVPDKVRARAATVAPEPSVNNGAPADGAKAK